MGFRYFGLYKPYGYLSQFTPDHPGQQTLASLFEFPKDIYPIGRLDSDSEGLLLLTNDNQLKTKILSPDSQVKKTYLAQVEGNPLEADLVRLIDGITINIRGKAIATAPAKARLIYDISFLSERQPPIRFRPSIPDQWVELILTEGKNRQVRRMLAAMGFPVLRLVRVSIGGIQLAPLQVGEVVEYAREAFVKQLWDS